MIKVNRMMWSKGKIIMNLKSTWLSLIETHLIWFGAERTPQITANITKILFIFTDLSNTQFLIDSITLSTSHFITIY